MISQDTIRNIINAARIEDVISDFVTLKKRGANYLGLCPFHDEKTASFTVSPAKGIYKCFGCGRAGDVVRFVMENDQQTYPEALRFLAGKYNIEIEETGYSKVDKEEESLKESLFLINSFAKDYFEDQLWNDEKGRAVALSYMLERGFDEKTIKHFNIGYNPEVWDAFSKTAIEKGYKKELLEKSGLTILKEDRVIDRFRSRVIFPIHNLSGRVIGFGGRSLKQDSKMAKYVNSPESEVYSKSFQLYGLYFAKKSIVKEDACLVVEGYTDVVSLFQSGVENAVAPLGTSLTQDQVKLIRRYSQNVVLLFDGDEAGAKASVRAIDMVLEEGMNVKIVIFPQGEDPDSYSKNHSDDALKDFIANNQQDFIAYRLEAGDNAWKGDPVKKAEMMKEILLSISKVPDHLLRSFLVKDLSQRTELSEQSAIYELNRLRRAHLKQSLNKKDQELQPPPTQFQQSQKQQDEQVDRNSERKEEKIIELLFKYGSSKLHLQIPKEEGEDEVMEISVSDYIIGELERDSIEFRNERFKRVYEFFTQQNNEDREVSQRDLLENEDEEIRNFSYDFSLNRYTLSENWENMYHILTQSEESDLKKSIDRAIYGLRLSEVMERLDEFEVRMKDAEADELQELMRKQKILSDAKSALAKKLGMTLT
ncbi:MAG: DNA primase [Vicingaceae bacterium]